MCIVGGGIVGLATAQELLSRYPGLKLAVVEKEDKVGEEILDHCSKNSIGAMFRWETGQRL